MSQQKKYQLPKLGGGEVEKTLAPPSNDRLPRALRLSGVESFSEIFDDALNVAKARLNIFGEEKLREALDVVLVEGSADIDLATIDLRLTDGILQDFFDQRSWSLGERAKS